MTPYPQFTFQLILGGRVIGGFQELSALEIEAPRKKSAKLKGLNKSTDVTLKRGVIRASALKRWRNDRRTVTIELQSETQQPLARWILHDATPVKYTADELNAKGSDVVIEELVLTCQRLESGRRLL